MIGVILYFVGGFLSTIGAWYFICVGVFTYLDDKGYDYDEEMVDSFWTHVYWKLFQKPTVWIFEKSEWALIVFIVVGCFCFLGGLPMMIIFSLCSFTEVTEYQGLSLLEPTIIITRQSIAPIYVLSYSCGAFLFLIPEFFRQAGGFVQKKYCLKEI